MYKRKKIVDLRNFITTTLTDYEYEKINSSDNEFVDRLKMICYFIDEKIISTIEYYQYNKAPITEIEKAKDKCKDLSILLNKYKTELTKLGINPNEQLSFKKEVNDAFDFELTENTKELLPNYLEIKKEFEDFIKIETSTKEKPQQINNLFETYFINETAFNNFEKYIKDEYILDEFSDFSYLFQRMKKENLIIPKTHIDFAEWLNKKGYLKNNGLDRIIINKGFKSKPYSVNRENNYNRVFDKK